MSNEKIAHSIASMVTEWVEGGIRGGTDWRNGLSSIIQKRLDRYNVETSPAAWMHRLNMELGQFSTEFTVEAQHPFGEPGEDFDASYTVDSIPLYRALPTA